MLYGCLAVEGHCANKLCKRCCISLRRLTQALSVSVCSSNAACRQRL